VTFDPFGDYETEGYLRNFEKVKDLDIVKRLEHASFTTGIDEAFAQLAKPKQLGYEHLLQTHKILFDAVYPWAGQDRLQTTPKLAIKRGNVIFAYPQDIRRAVKFALQKGQDKDTMASKPGEIMGYLAFGHPFLDGNGRAIMTMHSVLAQRAGFSIDWSATSKDEYLDALTRELDSPGKGHLDAYLTSFKRDVIAYDQLAAEVARAPGLGGRTGPQAEFEEVLGHTDEPRVKAQYQKMLLKREQK
jgi:cell filamentation protein